MKLSYYPDTDSAYIHFSDKPGADVVEVSDTVVVDVDEDGIPVGMDISANASRILDLSRLRLERNEGRGSDALLDLATGFMLQPVEVTGRDVG